MSMKILWFNWRCIKHPLAGGAEVYTHEIARRLARKGHDIILVTSRPSNLPREEVIDGYRVIRNGNTYSLYFKARVIYEQLKVSGWRPDIVVDEINTIPFMTPCYVKEPITVLIHQLCRECWRYALLPLPEKLGKVFESTLHKIYVKATMKGAIRYIVTVSQSTLKDLLSLGYPRQAVRVIYNGLDWKTYGDCACLAQQKEELVVYIGRIAPYKRIEDLIIAWKIVEKTNRHAKLIIGGRPYIRYLARLRRLSQRLGLHNIEFKTNLSVQEKKLLLARAKILVYTSVREGWGQTVLEAAACKTPTIAYDVPGLREAVINGVTGVLVRPNDIKGLADAISSILTNEYICKKLAEGAYKYARRFSWERTAQEFEEVLRGIS